MILHLPVFRRFIREVHISPQKDKLFPKKVGQLLKQYLDSMQDYFDTMEDKVGSTDIDLYQVFPNPMKKLFKKKSIDNVRRLFKEMESYSEDSGRENPERTAFLGVIILFYIVIMKNLFFVGVSPLMFSGISVQLPLEFSELGISKRSLMKLIPVLDYIDMSVDDILKNDIERHDINYFHVIFKRLVNSEV